MTHKKLQHGGPRKAVPPEVKAEAVRRALAGDDLKAIAADLGISVPAVSKWRVAAGGTKKDVRIPEDNFTEAQFASLAKLVKELLARYPGATVHGHCEYAAKACPVFSVKAFLRKWGL